MALYIGIDPGKTGAIAVMDGDDMSVRVYDMPGTIEEKRAILSEIGSVRCAWIEKPFFPRAIGTANVAKIAQAYGEMKACLFFAGVPTNEVPPAMWKKHFGLSTDKDASRAYASSVFPDQSNLWARKKDDGSAEANFGLIAAYWSAHLNTNIKPHDVAVMMTLLKLARAKSNPAHADNAIDAAGYSALAGEIGSGEG